VSTTNATTHRFIDYKSGKLKAVAQVTGAYQQSVHMEGISQYFLFPGKSQLLVTGDDVTSDFYTRNIRAEFIGLPSTFQGSFTVNPQQRQEAAFIDFNQDISAYWDHELMEGSWVTVSIPVVHVENNIQLSEFNVNGNGTAYPNTIAQAFSQPTYLYAKICGKNSITQLADLTIRLGRTFLNSKHNVAAMYTNLVFPSGNKQNPSYIFSPVAGTDGHFGYGGGTRFQIRLNQDPTNFGLVLFLDLDAVFYARNTQKRTYDLIDKPYSRYLPLIKPNSTETIPATNVLTLKTQVHPFTFADFSCGFRFITAHAELELCYGIWGRGPEQMNLRCNFPQNYGIAGTFDPTTGFIGTSSQTNIGFLAPNDPEFVALTINDLDLDSGAGRSAFNNKFQIAVGFWHKGKLAEIFCAAGTYYDVPMKNSALNLIGAFLKLGASF
ncbi:MAG: hypothetical protein ACHQVS_02755, partial [Candidatus Babeliales bacterium]